MCAISRASFSARYHIRENTFPCERNIAYEKMHFHERQHVLSGILPGIPWCHGIPLVGFPSSCHSKLAWPWTESTATMLDKKSCGAKLTYEQLSAMANFIWFRQTVCLRRRSTSKISCSLLAILCFDRQGQGHKHAHCKHISRNGKIAYEKFAHRATESRMRNHPCARSHTWKCTHTTAPERIFHVRYCAHGKWALLTGMELANHSLSYILFSPLGAEHSTTWLRAWRSQGLISDREKLGQSAISIALYQGPMATFLNLTNPYHRTI